MTVSLKPISTIKARIGIQPNGPVQSYFTQQCYKYMGKYVPGGESGYLNTNVSLKTDSITYSSPYAHYQYMGELYVMPSNGKGAYYSEDYGYWSKPGVAKVPTGKSLHYHTPGTGAFWDKRMWTSEGKKVVENVQKFVDRGGK